MRQQADLLVEKALAAARHGGDALYDALEDLPAPVYVTDEHGWITAFNEACVGFAGRRPTVGMDRWCVSWKLYSEDGEPLPHNRCPMAIALVEMRAVRGATAVAERPDGSLVTFTPFPTPLFDATGGLAGGVNLLLDVTAERRAEALRAEAEGCRRLAAAILDNARALNDMAAECDARAGDLEAKLERLSA